MTDWKATRDGLKAWFQRLAKVDHVEWQGEPEVQFPPNASWATLSIGASSELGTGWEGYTWNAQANRLNVDVTNHKRVVLHARIRSWSQLPGEDAWCRANRAETLVRGSRSTEDLTRLGWSYHGLAGELVRNDFEHQGRETSQVNMDLVMSFASVIRDEPVFHIERVEGTLTVKDPSGGDADVEEPFAIDLTQLNQES